MALSNLSEEERHLFYEKLQYRYEARYKKMANEDFIPWTALSNTGITLIAKKKIRKVAMYPFKETSNLIIFYSRDEKDNVRNLLAHLRNSIAHNYINKKALNGISHYEFIDKRKVEGKYQKTMKGFIKATDWEKFVDFIYEESKLLQSTTNTHI